MRILFVNAIRNKFVQKSYYPLGFGYLVSYAGKYGCVFDSLYSEQVTPKLLRSFNPDVLALSCSTENFSVAVHHAHVAKKYNPKIKVVIGGVHVSAAPNSLTSDFDIGVIGEGEQTFFELFKNDFMSSNEIKGIVYRGIQTEPRPHIEPLDNIPHPDRSIFGGSPRTPYIFTSRGCPYKCRFCSSSHFWGKVRLHSPEYVAEEIGELAAQGIKHIQIFDDTFLIDVDRAKKIGELVSGLGLTFGSSARANQITDESVLVLKNMGVVNMGLGFESNSARVLLWLNKCNTPEINQNAVDTLRRHNMKFAGSFIVDTPVETKEDVAATKRFIKQNKIPYNMNGLMGFPGTPIYAGSTDWDRMKCRDYLPVHMRLKRRLAQIKPVRNVYKRIEKWVT